MIDYISERTAGQIIGDSIQIYVGNFLVIVLIYALPLLPVVLCRVAAQSRDDQLLGITLFYIEVLMKVFIVGAVTLAVSDVCVGNRPSIKRSYNAIRSAFWRYLGTYILWILAIILGMALLVLPGFYVIVVLLFSLPVCIIEHRSPIAALRRSMALGKGYYLRNFGVIVLIVLVGNLAMGVIVGMAAIILSVFGFSVESTTFNLILNLVVLPMTPLFQIPTILLYYDMRARKENFDGAALAQELMT